VGGFGAAWSYCKLDATTDQSVAFSIYRTDFCADWNA
jgi:hypothetical protein